MDQEAIVHAVFEPPQGSVGDRIPVQLTVEGPDHTEQIQQSREVSGAAPQLVTLSWTPDEPGTHQLRVDARFGSQVVPVTERTVYVAPQEQEEGPSLVDRAPGSVQWAIVGAGVYLFLRSRSEGSEGD